MLRIPPVSHLVRSHTDEDSDGRLTTAVAKQPDLSNRHLAASDDDEPAFPLPMSMGGEEEPEAGGSPLVVALAFFGGIGLLMGAGYVFKDSIRTFLDYFIGLVDDGGPLGYLAYAVAYTALEVLAVPAIPLTMTAGVIFGPVLGTLITLLSGTVAATIAFIIARYGARDQILKYAQRNKRFAAIDRAIAKDGFKFVTLLRLSPLLPLSVSNYLYGLTSVELVPYIFGTMLGMAPGTYAYVSAGHIGKAVLAEAGEGSTGVEAWPAVWLGLGATLLAIAYVGRLAKKAIDEVDHEQQDGSVGKGQ